MAVNKKKAPEVKAPPIISKLPIAISDSPLVIDLPDGQKLVVGRMVQGSVIEVATWRGTGRPDSRTSRLMLGMSIDGVSQSAEEKAAEEAANATNAPERRTSAFSNPQLAMVQEFFWGITSHPIYQKLFGNSEKKPGRKSEKKAHTPKAVATTPTSSEQPVTSAPSATITSSAPTPTIATIPEEPVSPFATSNRPASRKKQEGALNLFGKKRGKISASKNSVRTSNPWTSTPTTSQSDNSDIDAWLDEISSKAKARAENKAAKPSAAVKKAPVAKKTAKKSAPVAKKRK